MPRRTISSPATFLLKILFPSFFIVLYGTIVISLWFGKASHNPPSAMEKFIITIGGLGFVLVQLWAYSDLKKVCIDNKYIYISNYLKEVSIPFDAIKNVAEINNFGLRQRVISIQLTQVTLFGDIIIFAPIYNVFRWQSHPIVIELQKLAGLKK